MDDTTRSHVVDRDMEPPHRAFRCSWIAYVRPAAFFLIMVLVGWLICSLSLTVGIVWLVLALALWLYGYLMTQSIRLFTDDDGVWLYQGIFPWNKGVFGVKWRDLDEAIFAQSFFSWAFKAYSVRIGHRYTKDSEVFVGHIHRGDHAVEHINRLHLDMIDRQGQDFLGERA